MVSASALYNGQLLHVADLCTCMVHDNHYRIAGIFRGYKCSQFSRIEPVPRKFIPTKIYNSRRVQYYGFEANGVEVQLHVDVRMRQKAGTQTTKIKSAKSFVMVHPQKFIPSK